MCCLTHITYNVTWDLFKWKYSCILFSVNSCAEAMISQHNVTTGAKKALSILANSDGQMVS